MNLKKIAIVQLCYADYEALEIALAAYTKLTNPNVHIYLLQNGRGTYDTERTYRVCLRYQKMFPKQITVVDWIQPGAPFVSIKTLLESNEMKSYDYICKVDDDVFPLTSDWLEKLIACYENSYRKYGRKLGYVTSLVNNNPWGFKQVVEAMGLDDEFQKISVAHYIGVKNDNDSLKYRFVEKGRIHPGGGGSVWALPFYARWIHNQTTLHPEDYVRAVQKLPYREVDNRERYSINCMLFKKSFWTDIDIGHTDDEYQTYSYCRKNNKKIVADLSVPMVHICFFTQREENRDLLPQMRVAYERFLKLPFPIAMCPLKEYENENRLRWLENRLSQVESGIVRIEQMQPGKKSFLKYLFFRMLYCATLGKVKQKYKKKYKSYK